MPDMEMKLNLSPNVRHYCSVFQEETGIEVTEVAQNLITAIFEAFVMDPHPSWEVGDQKHLENMRMLMKSLPTYLKQVSAQKKYGDPISSFDVLLWLSISIKDICPYFCPF